MSSMREFFSEGLSAINNISSYDVDMDQLSQGISVELEHTNDVRVAEKIALDHLAEHPRYYDALADMEAALEAGEYD